SRDRLVLDIELSKKNDEYNFPIVFGDKNYYGKTIKPNQMSVLEMGQTDSLINKRLKYSIYISMTEYSRVYMKLPDQDSVLLELPVRWHPREQYRWRLRLLEYKHPILYTLKKSAYEKTEIKSGPIG